MISGLCIIVYCISVLSTFHGHLPNEGKDFTMKINIISATFPDSGMIPLKYTCDGDDISPPLSWSSVPEGTASFALICDDPDAPVGTWVHWVMYDIPKETRYLAEAFTDKAELEDGTKQGINDFRRTGYGGPCPPGGTHRYFFRIFALDILLNKKPGMTKFQLLKSIEGHILGEGILMGKYKRSQ